MPSEEIKENGQKLCGEVEMGRRNLKEEPKNAVSNITTALQRKVLTEKNDDPPSACSGTNSEGNPEVKKPGQVHCHPYAAAPEVASFPSMVQSHRAGEETVVSSEMQTYDPLTNYLSPRPKFLRYNPNKRQEIYHRRQRGRKGAKGSLGFDLCGSFEARSPSSDKSPSDRVASPSMKQETSSVKRIHGKETSGGVEEAEEHDITKEEEEDEEMPSACNPVWKCLLLFGVLFFSTCYITSSQPWPDVSCLQDFLLSKGNLGEKDDATDQISETAPFTIVLVVLAVAASTIIGLLKFWRMPKTSTRDSSGSFPSPGMVSDGRNGTKVANTKKMKDKDSDVLAKADYHKKDNYEDQAPTVKLAVERKGKGLKYLVDEDKCRKVHESYTPSMKLLDDRFGITDLDTARYNDPCERNPPAVKLLGEFSITEQGMSETKNPSLWRKNFKIEELHSLPQEMLRRKSSPMIEEANQTSPEALPHESAICITPAPKEPTRKQGGNHKQEAEKLASTPVRRSSRIRHRVTSPKT